MEPNQRPTQPTEQTRPSQPYIYKKRRGFKRTFMMLLLAALFLAGGAAAGYWYRDRDAKSAAQSSQSEIDSLKSNLSKSAKELADAKAAAKKDAAACTGTSAEQLKNIEDAIKSGNTAAIESHMQPSVNVILAASEAYGPRTPAQAVKDLDFLDKATDPWDFDLPDGTIDSYQKGDYKQYFPDGSLVGKSANNYVVSFQFDSCGKLYGIFMTSNAGLLS